MNSKMYEYIIETPDVLMNIITKRSLITNDFVTFFKDRDIDEIYIIGAGTSYHAGLAAQKFIEEVMRLRVTVVCPSHFFQNENIKYPKSMIIGVSQEGSSASTIGGLDYARKKGLLTAAVSAKTESAISMHADIHTMIEVGTEQCGAKTKGYSGTTLTLMLMFLELALMKGLISLEEYQKYLLRMNRVVESLRNVIDSSIKWYNRIQNELTNASRIIIVGNEAMYANTLEGALKILESLRVGCVGYEMDEFCHGIYNSINKDTYIFYLSFKDENNGRIIALEKILKDWTSHNYLIMSSKMKTDKNEKNLVYDFLEDDFFSTWEYIIPLQIIACLASQDRGMNPDIPLDPNFHIKIGSKVRVENKEQSG